jgi:membrane associated rhomboid family serine protease
MGLLDREYYREEEGGPFTAWLRKGSFTKIIVVLNVLFFVIQVATQTKGIEAGAFTDALSLVGGQVMGGEIWRLLTYAFLHTTDSLMPFLFNLTVLWVVGQEVEERMGRARYLAFYLLAALIGGLGFVAAAKFGLNGTTLEKTRVLGATAPLTALLVWLTLQSPRLKVLFFYAFPIPVWALLAVAVGFDFWGIIQPGQNEVDGRRLTLIGHLATAVFAAGVQLASRPPRRPKSRRPARPTRERPDLRIFRGEHPPADDNEQTETVPTPSREADELLEAQLDAVLAKVADQGQTSLSSAEREILQRASEVYRKRRG